MSYSNQVITAQSVPVSASQYDDETYLDNEVCYGGDWCCFSFLRGIAPGDLFDGLPEGPAKAMLRKHVDHYNARDIQFVYFVALAFISTFVGAMFAFGNLGDCDSKSLQVRNLVIWMSSFTLFCVGMRIYFFKIYKQNPVIAIFQMHTSDVYDKCMNLTFVAICLGSVAIYVAMFTYAMNHESVKAIIMMCILIGAGIFDTAWYKLIVRRINRLAKVKGLPTQVTNVQTA